FQAEDGIRDFHVTGVQTCALPISVTGKASFNQLASELRERTGSGMSRQSLHERLDERATAFLMAVLCALMEQRFKPVVTGHGERSEERRVGKECRSGG